MSKSARAWESDIWQMLEICPCAQTGLFFKMWRELETKMTAVPSDRACSVRLSVIAICRMVEREADSVPGMLRRLDSVGLVELEGDTIDLPQARRIVSIRLRDRAKKGRGSEFLPPQGGNSYPSEKVDKTSGKSTLGGGNSDPRVGIPTLPPPQVSSPPITPSSSFPSPGVEKSREVRWAECRTFAVNWLSVNLPSHLRTGKDALAELVFRIGKEAAIAEVRQAMAIPRIKNPLAYARSRIDAPPDDAPAVQHKPQPRRAIGLREDN